MPRLTRPNRVEFTTLVALAAANVALTHVVPRTRSREIPAHLASAALIVALTSDRDSKRDLLESVRRNIPSGVKLGLAVGAPIGTALTVGAFVPATRRFFLDERIAGSGVADALYQFVARIPLATAVGEEVIFRLAIPDLLKRRRSTLEAELTTAALFGLWHVLPTIDRLHTNPGTAAVHRRSLRGQAAVVGATVAATAFASLGFAKLRDMSGSIAAPIIVHAAFNGGGFLGGWLSSRLAHDDDAADAEALP